jgi:Leucine-rich repeat (LRR) protein
MNWIARLTKTPYIVLFVMLISVGMTSAYALSINLDGDVISYLGTLDMNNNKITNVGSPITSSDVATKGYVDSSDSTVTEILDMNNNKITNVGSPITPSDVATKGYADSSNPAGTEILDMNNNKITNVGSPIASSDVATKDYVDSASTDTLSSLSCSFDEIPRWNGIKWECGKL